MKISSLARFLNYFALVAVLSLLAMQYFPPTTSALRTLRHHLALVVYVVAPGSALVQWLSIRHAPLQFGTIVALSLATDIFLSEALRLAELFEPKPMAIALLVVTLFRPYHLPTTLRPSTFLHFRKAQ